MSIAAGGGRMKQIIIIGAGPAGLTAAYELLEWQRYKEILDNIIYLGLPRAAREILAKTGGKEGPDAAQL